MVPASLSWADALLFRRDDIARQHRQHGAVHGHRHGHLVQRDIREQDLHVLDAVDRDARLADIADDARMVAVIAAMGREVEGDRQAHLTGREVRLVELVALLGRGEAGVLPDRPGTVRVHGRPWPTGVGRKAGERFQLQPGQIVSRIERLDGDAFRRVPDQGVRRGATGVLGCQRGPVGQRLLGEINHGTIPPGPALF